MLNQTEVKNKIKFDINKEIFEGFIDELFESDSTDYYKGRLIALFFIKCGDYEE
jgi:hypothetical protein